MARNGTEVIQWDKIRDEYIEGATQDDLAKKYKVKRQYIAKKCSEGNWYYIKKNKQRVIESDLEGNYLTMSNNTLVKKSEIADKLENCILAGAGLIGKLRAKDARQYMDIAIGIDHLYSVYHKEIKRLIELAEMELGTNNNENTTAIANIDYKQLQQLIDQVENEENKDEQIDSRY